MASNKKYYHYEIIDNEDKIHLFSTRQDINNYYGNISKRLFYYYLSPDNDYCIVKKNKTKHEKIKNIKRIKIPRINYYNDNYLCNNNNTILH